MRIWFEAHVKGWGGDSHLGDFETYEEAAKEAFTVANHTVLVWKMWSIELPFGWVLKKEVIWSTLET